MARLSPEEIRRQYVVLSEGAITRLLLTSLIYFFAMLFVPWALVLGLMLTDFALERLSIGLMSGLKPSRTPWRYGAVLATGMLSQFTYAMLLISAYVTDTAYARSFAIGAIMLSMMQMIYSRAIHLPIGVVRLVATVIATFLGIVHHWPGEYGYPGLALSLIALGCSSYFIASVLRDNNRLHVGIAKERAAARAADEAKSRFLAQMSHELRTPLNAILGLGHVELALSQDPASRERMKLVTDAAKGLAEILDDILDMSAIEAGRLTIHPTACDPSAEIASAIALFLPLYQSQGLTINLWLAANLPKRAQMDAQRLRQCLSNLLSNALKHTETGGVVVRAEIASDGKLAITMADTGPGIAPEMADRLFQPFHRGAGDKPGNGLGLSITKAVARSMGGNLVLLSSSCGAQFLLTLAIDAVSADAADTLPRQDAPPTPDLRGLTVLVVDDIATNRLVAKAHLGLLGIKATEAASGEAALASIRANPPDLVLLDMNMPGMDGISTLKRIRILPSRAARLPVIAMTADATDAHRRHYLAAGLDDYLAKPLTPETLTAVLKRSLAAARSHQPCITASGPPQSSDDRIQPVA